MILITTKSKFDMHYRKAEFCFFIKDEDFSKQTLESININDELVKLETDVCRYCPHRITIKKLGLKFKRCIVHGESLFPLYNIKDNYTCKAFGKDVA